MFESLRQILNNARSVSEASDTALKSSARKEAILDALEKKTDSVVFSRWKLAGTSDQFIVLNDPYPEYPAHAENLAAANQLAVDREMIHMLERGKSIDLTTALLWVKDFNTRDGVRERMHSGDDMALARTIQEASFSPKQAARTIIEEKCIPILRRIMPDAFIPPQEMLKKTLAKRLFRDSSGIPSNPENIAVSTVSSLQILAGTVKSVIKPGSKVVLPIPYFDPFPIFLDKYGAEVITADTTKTGFKLRAEDLEALIAKNHMGKGDWLVLTVPNNATMTNYSKKEMQAIADVVAKSGIRAICDELYAGFGEERVSLSSLESWQQGGPVKMSDRVITISGCSKQFPFGSDMKRKIGAGCFPTQEEAVKVENCVYALGSRVADNHADMYTALINGTPGRVRSQALGEIAANGAKMRDIVAQVNGRVKKVNPTHPALEMFGGEEGYLASLKLSPVLCSKVGIRDGDDLMDYLIATTRIVTSSLRSEGVKEPMVRINTFHAAAEAVDMQFRLDTLVKAIENGTAPKMQDVRQSFNREIQLTPGISDEHKRLAQRT